VLGVSSSTCAGEADALAGRNETRRVTRRRALRATWLVVASVLAATGLQLGFDARGHAERWFSSTPVLIYLAVVAVLGAVSYALHAAFGKSSSGTALRPATIDTAVLAVGGASLLLIVQLAVTIRDCSIGTGC
jgi:cytochrome bd-type quinol oxidase subunit 2